MSRDIKFRAWDCVRNEYLSAGKVMIQVLPGKLPSSPKGLHLDTSSFMCAEGRMELQQFTGLVDKNGIEIYEGDVSPYLECSRQGKINAQVYYCTETAQFRVKWIDGGVENFDTLDDCINWLEVIGNVHQNPELIK